MTTRRKKSIIKFQYLVNFLILCTVYVLLIIIVLYIIELFLTLKPNFVSQNLHI